MAQIKAKYKKSKYKYVIHEIINDTHYWKINVPNHTQKRYKNEIEAAKAVDYIMIKLGKTPLNILKRL